MSWEYKEWEFLPHNSGIVAIFENSIKDNEFRKIGLNTLLSIKSGNNPNNKISLKQAEIALEDCPFKPKV